MLDKPLRWKFTTFRCQKKNLRNRLIQCFLKCVHNTLFPQDGPWKGVLWPGMMGDLQFRGNTKGWKVRRSPSIGCRSHPWVRARFTSPTFHNKNQSINDVWAHICLILKSLIFSYSKNKLLKSVQWVHFALIKSNEDQKLKGFGRSRVKAGWQSPIHVCPDS